MSHPKPEGTYFFQKLYLPVIADLNEGGEEFTRDKYLVERRKGSPTA